MNPIVVDLSHWNATPNWKQLSTGGTMGVIHKVTEGCTYVDDQYGHRENDARKVGLMWASYHFLKHGDIAEQMQWYVDRAGLAAGGRAIIDFEDAATTLGDLEEAVGWLLDHGYEVTVYGDGHLTEVIGEHPNPLLTRTSLWQARYNTKEPKVPPPWLYWSMWQYTDKAEVMGCPEPVDGNKWHSTPSQLTDWFNGTTQPKPKPEPPPMIPIVEISINVPDGIAVSVDVNGLPYVPAQES